MKKFVVALAGLLLISLMPATAYADVNDFVIESFGADYRLTNEDKQGTLHIQETIEVTFSDQNHGILRAIPDHYKKHRLQMDVTGVRRDGRGEQWSTYGSNGNTVIKIGDAGSTITGNHTYQVFYTLRNVVSFYDGHDELFWDINGDQWQQVTRQVLLTLHLPENLQLSEQRPTCYTGSFGSQEQACTIDANEGMVTAQTTRELQAYENMSIVVGFGKGYFEPSPWTDTAGEYAAMAAKVAAPILLIAGTAYLHWRRHGRDPKGRRVIVPEYGAPDGLKPIEAGTVADFRTDNRDITATVIDLAIRGYIKIIETVKDRKILKDQKLYSLRLENTDFSQLDQFEKKLLGGIFSRHEKGEEIDLSTLKYKLASTAAELQSDVKKRLVEGDYFRKTPLSTSLKFVGKLALAVLASVVLAVVFQGGAVVLGIIVGVAAATVFIILLPSRTEKGVAARDSILGLKMYLEVAEAERIKKLQSPDAPYAAKSHEPKKTVELFEKLLPYAMVLGVEEKWAKQFEHIYRTPPDWYQGNWHAFNAVYLTSALNSGVQSNVNAAFSSPSSSGSSGFSGGSSGGGGGGGGGGGW